VDKGKKQTFLEKMKGEKRRGVWGKVRGNWFAKRVKQRKPKGGVRETVAPGKRRREKDCIEGVALEKKGVGGKTLGGECQILQLRRRGKRGRGGDHKNFMCCLLNHQKNKGKRS